MTQLLVHTQLPDAASAQALATLLLEQRLAACVSILASVRSLYRWQGKLEISEEVPLLIKTVAARYAEVEALIKAQHPYELPEIIATPITLGLPGYLAWLETETAAVVQSC